MRKNIKRQIDEILNLMKEAQEELTAALVKANADDIFEILESCQNGAINVGNTIEESEGKDTVTVKLLENYCEVVYQVYENALQKRDIAQGISLMSKTLGQIFESVEKDIRIISEVVFLPYKASMWDSLESVWKAACEDESCNVYVVPIPYYDKDGTGALTEMHYEGDEYPEYVPIMSYEDYDFASRQPDMIFIHNPYDEHNQVTSVHPFFYAKNIKQYTEKLVYIPYFVLKEIKPENVEAVKNMEHFVLTPGVIHSDKVIVQSEDMRQIYVNVLSEYAGEETRSVWENKILGLGSPKFDKVTSVTKEECQIPEEWKKIFERPDGGWKKIILYNTSLTSFLKHKEQMLIKMQNVFTVFKENQEDVALLWRPHPLLLNTIETMRPELKEAYTQLVEEYRAEGWGIYDDTADLNRALTISDAYYGDPSSLVHLCQKRGTPVMIQNVNVL